MKARVPFDRQLTQKDVRKYQRWVQTLLVCYTLHTHFGFGLERLKRFLEHHSEDANDLARMDHGYIENDTWQDELWAWGDHMGLNELVTGKKG